MTEHSELTQDQVATLATFADNLREGRRIAVGISRALVWLGSVAGAAAAVATVWSAWHGH